MSATREAIILAGGLGSRLAGVVPGCPKAMALVGGRPFLEWQLDYLISQGVTRVVLSVGHLADQITAHLGNRYREIEIAYSRERIPLGTGGALKLALEQVEGRGAFALNGDTLLLTELGPMEGGIAEMLVIAVREVADAVQYDTVLLEGSRVIALRGKGDIGPAWVNAGVYWLDRNLFDTRPLPAAFSFETDFVAVDAAVTRPRAHRTDGYFVDIGTPASYAHADKTIPGAFDQWRARYAAGPQ